MSTGMNDLVLTDCHCHISHRLLEHDGAGLRAQLGRCVQTGVGTIAVSIFDTESQWLPSLQKIIASHQVKVLVTLGMEPPSLSRGMARLEQRLVSAFRLAGQMAEAKEIAAIGETGLDYYWPAVNFLESRGFSNAAVKKEMEYRFSEIVSEPLVSECIRIQQDVFIRWISLAKSLGLPLVIHEREAFEDTLQIVEKSGIAPNKVMFHCFGHGVKEARRILDAGYWISLPSSLAFREPFRSVADMVPLHRLLLETDSPYHSPVPGLYQEAQRLASEEAGKRGLSGKVLEDFANEHRKSRFIQILEEHLPWLLFPDNRTGQGSRSQSLTAAQYFLESSDNRRVNESALIRSSAWSLAGIRGMTFEEICRMTTENAGRVYGFSV